jgi:hypothetical protein
MPGLTKGQKRREAAQDRAAWAASVWDAWTRGDTIAAIASRCKTTPRHIYRALWDAGVAEAAAKPGRPLYNPGDYEEEARTHRREDRELPGQIGAARLKRNGDRGC